MTKVLKMLAGGGLAAVLGVVLLGLSGSFGATDAAAQAPPARPARFVGSVTIDGTPAPAGTVIEARIGSASCGVTTVFTQGSEARYAFDVQALQPSGALNCGTDGATVTFVVGGKLAAQTGTWRDYDLNTVNLTVVTPTPTPSASASPTSGSATATPKPPVTGAGTASDGSSNAWLLAILGAGVLAFGVGGAAVARRGR